MHVELNKIIVTESVLANLAAATPSLATFKLAFCHLKCGERPAPASLPALSEMVVDSNAIDLNDLVRVLRVPQIKHMHVVFHRSGAPSTLPQLWPSVSTITLTSRHKVPLDAAVLDALPKLETLTLDTMDVDWVDGIVPELKTLTTLTTNTVCLRRLTQNPATLSGLVELNVTGILDAVPDAVFATLQRFRATTMSVRVFEILACMPKLTTVSVDRISADWAMNGLTLVYRQGNPIWRAFPQVERRSTVAAITDRLIVRVERVVDADKAMRQIAAVAQSTAKYAVALPMPLDVAGVRWLSNVKMVNVFTSPDMYHAVRRRLANGRTNNTLPNRDRLIQFPQLLHLARVELNNVQISDAAIAKLAVAAPSLATLKLLFCQIAFDKHTTSVSFPLLTEIVVKSSGNELVDLVWMLRAPIKHVHAIFSSGRKPSTLPQLWPSVSNLEIEAEHKMSLDAAVLDALPGLKKLTLDITAFYWADRKVVPTLKSLTTLRANAPCLRALAQNPATLSGLVELTVTNVVMKLPDAVFHTLQRFRAPGCYPSVVEALARMPCLTRFSVDRIHSHKALHKWKLVYHQGNPVWPALPRTDRRTTANAITHRLEVEVQRVVDADKAVHQIAAVAQWTSSASQVNNNPAVNDVAASPADGGPSDPPSHAASLSLTGLPDEILLLIFELILDGELRTSLVYPNNFSSIHRPMVQFPFLPQLTRVELNQFLGPEINRVRINFREPVAPPTLPHLWPSVSTVALTSWSTLPFDAAILDALPQLRTLNIDMIDVDWDRGIWPDPKSLTALTASTRFLHQLLARRPSVLRRLVELHVINAVTFIPKAVFHTLKRFRASVVSVRVLDTLLRMPNLTMVSVDGIFGAGGFVHEWKLVYRQGNPVWRVLHCSKIITHRLVAEVKHIVDAGKAARQITAAALSIAKYAVKRPMPLDVVVMADMDADVVSQIGVKLEELPVECVTGRVVVRGAHKENHGGQS
ncbi:hypothetical protein GGF32_008476 [Allomyces javanicus]|nr:hypothetical protein GGF32_008476 [Allomyces javanicus]